MYQNKNELSDLIKRAYCDIEAMKKVALKACGGLESLGKLEDLVLDDIDEMLLEFHQMEKEEEMAPLCVEKVERTRLNERRPEYLLLDRQL